MEYVTAEKDGKLVRKQQTILTIERSCIRGMWNVYQDTRKRSDMFGGFIVMRGGAGPFNQWGPKKLQRGHIWFKTRREARDYVRNFAAIDAYRQIL